MPLLVNPQASHSIVAHQLPEVVSIIQRIAMVGLFITIFLMLKMLPPRPERYRRHRTVMMVLQWVLMPLTSVGFNSIASYNAQTHLALGKYLDKFDVTEKATLQSQQAAKDQNARAKVRQTVTRSNTPEPGSIVIHIKSPIQVGDFLTASIACCLSSPDSRSCRIQT